jgi:predicted Holliday junction resolvase-like endonuclease
MGFEIPALVGGLIVGALLVYVLLSQRTKQQARTMFNEWIAAGKMQIEREADQKAEQKHGEIARLNLKVWQSTELQRVKEEDQKELQRVIEEEEKKRKNSLDTSRDVLKGKIGEQMAPLFPEFRNRYNPADARFIGSPIDYIIFKNLSKVDSAEEAPLEIVFVDVKTGKSALTRAQQMIERAVSGEKKRVDFYTLRLDVAQHPVKDSFTEKVLTSSESKKAVQ